MSLCCYVEFCQVCLKARFYQKLEVNEAMHFLEWIAIIAGKEAVAESPFALAHGLPLAPVTRTQTIMAAQCAQAASSSCSFRWRLHVKRWMVIRAFPGTGKSE